MKEDKNLRKAFKVLVENLGGEVRETNYDVGGVYGINKTRQMEIEYLFTMELDKLTKKLNSLIEYLGLEYFEWSEIRKKKNDISAKIGK